MPFVDVPDPTTTGKKRKLFRYDADRALIQIKAEHGVVTIDLTEYKPGAEEAEAKARNTVAGQRVAKPE